MPQARSSAALLAQTTTTFRRRQHGARGDREGSPKRSATIEVIDERERVLGTGRFGTDRDGYQQMLASGRQHSDRAWAVEGCQGIGRHLAQRLVADGETAIDVPCGVPVSRTPV